MKNTRILITTLVLIMLLSYGSFAGKVQFEKINTKKDFNAALKKAEKNKKFLFLDFYADWCYWCQYMDQTTFSDEALGDYFQDKFISLKIDTETEFGSLLSDIYNVTAFPTFLVLTDKKMEVKRIEGFTEADEILKELGNVFSAFVKYQELKPEYLTNPENKQLLLDFALAASMCGYTEECKNVADTYFKKKTGKDLSEQEWDIIRSCYMSKQDQNMINLVIENFEHIYINSEN